LAKEVRRSQEKIQREMDKKKMKRQKKRKKVGLMKEGRQGLR